MTHFETRDTPRRIGARRHCSMRAAASAILVAAALSAAAQTAVDVASGSVRGDKLFDPAHAVYAAATVAGWGIAIDNDRGRLGVAVTPPGAAPYVIALNPEAAQVYRVLIAGERLVVLSWMNGSLATEVAIYDRNTGASVDRFWCYGAAPSPDGRWIAFVKFFPSHGVAQWESQYRLYDLALDARSNRPPLRTVEPGGQGRDPLVDVGSALYPVAPGERDRQPLSATVDSLHEQGSAIAWSSDSRRLGFVDRQGGVARLVVVEMPAASPVSLSTKVASLPQWGRVCGQAVSGANCRVIAADNVRIDLNGPDARLTVRRLGAARAASEVSVALRAMKTVRP